MQNELLEAMSSVQKSAFDAAKKLTEINLKAMSELTEKQMALSASYLNRGISQFEMAKDAKDYGSFMSDQAAAMKAYGEEAVVATRETMEILNSTRDELAAWMESGMDKAVSAVKAAPAKKAAA